MTIRFYKTTTSQALTRLFSLALLSKSLDPNPLLLALFFLLWNSNYVPKKTDACGSEWGSSSAFCLLPPATQDCGSDVAVMAECLHMMDAPSGSVDGENQLENVLQRFKSIVPEKIDVC
ncbi:hypothetical protein CFOL_v3_14860 [Cephalotus follicularis]|uniref:Uncharacterized protein n=1 Tax=Cephalotus follicularis TaxID=3775 RepID=A0A1Q3BTR2_CEPFO|nr:hypothetical protein CFOL_v3_14860 [Cephalotus follicularis]